MTSIPLPPIMIPPEKIIEPRHLRSVVMGFEDNSRRVLDIYTGWLVIDVMGPENGELGSGSVVSWVPLGTDIASGKIKVQTYPEGVEAIATASLSGFGHGALAAAVDKASIEPQQLPRTTLEALVLTVDIAVQGHKGLVQGRPLRGSLNRVSYQVTVLANTVGAPHTIDPATPVASF